MPRGVGHEHPVAKPVDEPTVGGKAFLQGQEEIEAADRIALVDGTEAGERIQVCKLTGVGLDRSLCLDLAARRIALQRDDRVCSGSVVFRGTKSELSHFVAHPARPFLQGQDKGIAMRVRQAPEPLHQHRVSSSMFKPCFVE